MTFQEPLLLWGLPAALLPVLIHLLNRLRFRSVPWAATMFLSAATRRSHRRSRLRHYLLLLLRTLAVLLLVLALSRPVTGGWIGGLLGGRPERVTILLDRSASMETRDPALQVTKREYALDLFGRAAAGAYAGSRVTLIESVLCEGQEVAPGAALKNLALTAATDTAADLPALFRAAYESLARERPGRSEIWVASDLQESNWRPDSPEWADTMARLAALPGALQVRVLALRREAARNTSVAVRNVRRGGGRERPTVQMGLDVRRTGGGAEAVPLAVTLDGARSQEALAMDSPDLRLHRSFDLPAGREAGGWGCFEIPADENARDNLTWFVYPAESARRGVVVTVGGPAARRLSRAVAPDPARLDSLCRSVAPESTADLDWDSLGLVVWQAPEPGPAAREALERFVRAGGVAVCFPPGQPDVPGPFGIGWKEIETAPAGAPFRPGPWEENEGPLARTDAGQSLAVARLDFLRRQMAVPGSGMADRFFRLASFADGQPLLLRAGLGRGQALVCTTLPASDWSTLGESPVLAPMMQRLLNAGASRLEKAENAVCGVWHPAGEGEIWTAVDGERRDPRWEAGVYRCGQRLVALNRPGEEDLPERVGEDRVRALFGRVPVRIASDLDGRAAGHDESEAWPILMTLCLLCLLGESALMLGFGVSRPAVPAGGSRT